MFDFTFFIIWVIVLPDYSRSYYECCFLWVFFFSSPTNAVLYGQMCIVMSVLPMMGSQG